MRLAAALLTTLLLSSALPSLAVADRSRDRAGQCQAAIDQARWSYRHRARELEAGRRAARKAARVVRIVEHVCEDVVAEADRPRFGAPCDDWIVPGEVLSAGPLARCLRATLEREALEALPEPVPPNVVVVLTDDQRWDALSSMPNVERLADQSVRFTHAFATSALCTPSRASLYSGLYAHHHGSTRNQQEFDDRDTLAPWLQAAGYTTGLFGKYRNDAVSGGHVPPGWSEWQAFAGAEDCPGEGCTPTGYFDYTLNENGRIVPHGERARAYSTDLLSRRVRRFIRRNRDRPFFAIFAPYAPHVPASPAPRHAGSLSDLLPWRPPNWGPRTGNDVPSWITFLRLIFTPTVAAAVDERRIGELESLRSVDDAVARMLAEIERLGLTDQTLFVFTSDQGIHWGEHGWAGKSTSYEPSIRIPLIARYPVLAPLPAIRDELVLNIDLAPTIAELASAETAPMDGRSLVPLLAGEGAPWRGAFLVDNAPGLIAKANRAVRTDRWKYIETYSAGPVFVELYDLETDPYELHNLAQDPDHAMVRALLALSLVGFAAD